MLFIHKTNPNFMFSTKNGIRRFNEGKLDLEDDLIEFIKNTEDFKNGLINEFDPDEEKSEKLKSIKAKK